MIDGETQRSGQFIFCSDLKNLISLSWRTSSLESMGWCCGNWRRRWSEPKRSAARLSLILPCALSPLSHPPVRAGTVPASGRSSTPPPRRSWSTCSKTAQTRLRVAKGRTSRRPRASSRYGLSWSMQTRHHLWVPSWMTVTTFRDSKGERRRTGINIKLITLTVCLNSRKLESGQREAMIRDSKDRWDSEFFGCWAVIMLFLYAQADCSSNGNNVQLKQAFHIVFFFFQAPNQFCLLGTSQA